jgi:hypothetical protein
MNMQPRPIPQETVEGLRPPLPGYPYFEHADHFPFRADATGYSAVNAWWLADASFLVYGNADFITRTFRDSSLPRQGFHVDWLGTARNNRGMVLRNDRMMAIVFRGTRLQRHNVFDLAEITVINEDDFWTDSRFATAASRVGGRVHEGFHEAYLEISDQLDALVRAKPPGQSIWFAGHSLGGALATLAAAHCVEFGIPLQGIYTYGCSRVGDAEFVRQLPEQSHYRFVHRDDWIPNLPPEVLGYQHAGALRTLGRGSKRKFWDDLSKGIDEIAASVKSMVREMRWDTGELPFKIAGLADHAAVYYATLLWNELLEAPEATTPRLPP